jgi:pimeloyl-ACP methyl ester carboxylesterase
MASLLVSVPAGSRRREGSRVRRSRAQLPVPRKDELTEAGVRYVVVPDAAHNVMIDNHGGFVEAVAPALG